MSQGMRTAKRYVLRVHDEVEIIKQSAIFYQFILKTNKSALYRIKINYLSLETYLQMATHRLYGPDVSGML